MADATEPSWALLDAEAPPADWLTARYPELRRMAAARLRGRAFHRTVGTTSLVHEAAVRIISTNRREAIRDLRHFFATAAYAMRSAIVDHCRGRLAQKRNMRTSALLHDPAAPTGDEQLLALDAALEDLAKVDPLAAEFVKLRFFAGVSADNAARCLGVSPRQGGRIWAFSRAWLAARLGEGGDA